MNARELADLIERGIPYECGNGETSVLIIRALRLLAAAEGGEGTPETEALHHRLVKASEGPQWIAGKDYCDMKDHARTLEQRCAALAARVRELEPDATRYQYLRSRNKDDVFDNDGERAGVWIDCTSEDGTLQLLTLDDADAAIDAARSK